MPEEKNEEQVFFEALMDLFIAGFNLAKKHVKLTNITKGEDNNGEKHID